MENETTAETEHAYDVANWRPFHNLKHEGIEILRYFPENARHVLSIVCLYRRCQQKSRPGTHSSSRQLNPFFFSLLSLPGGLLSTGVSFCLQQGGFLQSVKQSARWQVAQRPKTSTHWNNLPADSPLKVQIPPVSGRIHPLASHPESRNPHPLEQSARLQAAQRPKTSTHWNNPPAYRPLGVLILPVTGRITPLEQVYWRHE